MKKTVLSLAALMSLSFSIFAEESLKEKFDQRSKLYDPTAATRTAALCSKTMERESSIAILDFLRERMEVQFVKQIGQIEERELAPMTIENGPRCGELSSCYDDIGEQYLYLKSGENICRARMGFADDLTGMIRHSPTEINMSFEFICFDGRSAQTSVASYSPHRENLSKILESRLPTIQTKIRENLPEDCK